MIRSFDPELLRHAFSLSSEPTDKVDCKEWFESGENVILVEGDNYGLATYEYPGVYTVHWFFTVRGRAAIDMARDMIDELFKTTDAQTLRGLTPIYLKAARWLAKRVGFKSHNKIIFEDGKECEQMFLTKEEFYGHR